MFRQCSRCKKESGWEGAFKMCDQCRAYFRHQEVKARHKSNNTTLKEARRQRIAEHYDYCPFCRFFGRIDPPVQIIEMHHRNGKKERGRCKGYRAYKSILEAGFPDDLLAVCPDHHAMIERGHLKIEHFVRI